MDSASGWWEKKTKKQTSLTLGGEVRAWGGGTYSPRRWAAELQSQMRHWFVEEERVSSVNPIWRVGRSRLLLAQRDMTGDFTSSLLNGINNWLPWCDRGGNGSFTNSRKFILDQGLKRSLSNVVWPFVLTQIDFRNDKILGKNSFQGEDFPKTPPSCLRVYRNPEFLSRSPFVWRHQTAFSCVSLTLHSSVTFRSHSTSLPVHIHDPLSNNKTFLECCTWLLMKDRKQLGVPPPGLVPPTSCTFLTSIQASLRSQHQILIQSFLCFFCLKN